MFRNISRLSSFAKRTSISTYHVRTAVSKIRPSDKVEYSVFGGEKVDPNIYNLAKHLIVNEFTLSDEPLCYHISPRNFAQLVEPYINDALIDQTSIIATEKGIFAGICINNDFNFKLDKRFVLDLKKRDYFGFDIVFALNNELSREFRRDMESKDLLQPGQILRMLLVAVDPGYQHKGHATNLIEESVKRAKALGFKYVITESSTDYMTHATEKCGFDCLKTILYDEWEYPQGSNVHPKRGISDITGFKRYDFMVKKL